MKFIIAVIAIMAALVAVNLAFIGIDLDEGNVLVNDKKPASLDMVSSEDNAMMAEEAAMKAEEEAAMKAEEEAAMKAEEEAAMMEEIPIPVVRPGVLITEDTVGAPLVIEVEFLDDDGQIVDHVNYDLLVTQSDQDIISEEGAHRHPGKHPVHTSDASLSEDSIEITITLQGLGHGEDITEPIGDVTSSSITPVVAEPVEAAAPMDVEVIIPAGSGTFGCEETNECYIPYDVAVAAGGTVTWVIEDSTGHTVTSGDLEADANITGKNWPNGEGAEGNTGFDSGFYMPTSTYSHTFEEAGSYPYYCFVHPWMKGIVTVS